MCVCFLPGWRNYNYLSSDITINKWLSEITWKIENIFNTLEHPTNAIRQDVTNVNWLDPVVCAQGREETDGLIKKLFSLQARIYWK